MVTNKPLEEIQKMAQEVLDAGGTFHQKWTCASCGERVAMTESNALFIEALHEDCGHVTDLRKTGCGLLVVLRRRVRQEGIT